MNKGKLVLLTLLAISLALFLSGCSSTPTNQPPKASFNANPTSGKAPLEVSFDASSSSDPDGNIISYNWDFGDGSSSSGKTTDHTFNSSGNYTVELTVTDNDGATDTGSTTISVSGSSDAIELVNWDLKKDFAGDAKIEGSVKNNMNQETNVYVSAKFYNSSDVRIGNTSDIIWDLSPGVTATFTMWSAANYDKVDHVDIKAEKLWE